MARSDDSLFAAELSAVQPPHRKAARSAHELVLRWASQESITVLKPILSVRFSRNIYWDLFRVDHLVAPLSNYYQSDWLMAI